jgi:hypothetical protein
MIMVFKSRHTPGVRAHEINFSVGEVVTYQLLNGSTVDVTITSDFMTHAQAKYGGYEGTFTDTGETGFADVERIVGWENGR